ncbi:MAG: hypothetical protein IK102_00555 [Treponema sp.]|nr:hypothetical protein [Treponema sp.]
MYGFLLKKNFCDGWDNLLSVVIVNVLFLISMVGIVMFSAFITSRFADSLSDLTFYLIQAGILLLGIFILMIFSLSYGEMSVKIANFENARVVDFFINIPKVLLDAFLFAVLIVFIAFISFYSITFYIAKQDSIFSLFVGALIFWIDIFVVLALQWFVPIRCTFHNKFFKCIKKCFLIFMDNTGFSLFMAFYNLLLIALSILPIGFFPSVAGVAISKQNAFRIRMYKYDYLEEHPELKTPGERRKIPWEELIFEDRETLGPRKLRSFLFPWKDE